MSADLDRYLALTSALKLGKWILGNRAAVLFSQELDEVLWANAAGARLFGGTGMRALLESAISPNQPFIRQVRDAAAQIEGEEPLIRGFRISRGLSMEFIQCELSRLGKGADEAILLICTAVDAEAGQREHERAEQAVTALKGLADECAILDGHALVLAASKRFAEVAIEDDDIRQWMEALESGTQTRLVRPLEDPADNKSVCLLKLSDRPERYLVATGELDASGLVATPPEDAVSSGTGIEPAGSPHEETGAGDCVDESAASTQSADDYAQADRESANAKDEAFSAPSEEEPAFPSGSPVEPRAEEEVLEEETTPDTLPAETSSHTKSDDDLFLDEEDREGEGPESGEHDNPEIWVQSDEPDEEDVLANEGSGSTQEPKSVRSLLERWFMRRGDEEGERAEIPFTDREIETGDGDMETSGNLAQTGVDAGESVAQGEAGHQDHADADTEPGMSEPEAGPEAKAGLQGNDHDTRDDTAQQESAETDDSDTEVPADRDDGEFVFAAHSEPVRFAWTIDDNQTFRSVSPELAATLGPNAADVVGRQWTDVARVFGFDTSGEVSRLLEKRDTWSGKMVLWPVQGTDLVVPVDLAALPSFGSSRSFDGFRGFGIIRTSEAVVDPNETGMALTGGVTSAIREPAAAGADQDDFGDEHDVERAQLLDDDFEPETEADNASEADATPQSPQEEPPASSGNVVSLPGVRREQSGEERRLNSAEERAFREIGNRLGSEGDSTKTAEERIAAHSDAGRQGEILEQLPYPVIVYRNGTTLYANSALMSVTGYTTIDQIDAAGGVEALFDGGGMEVGENRTMELRHRNGGRSQVSPVLKSVPWGKGKALLLTFRPATAGDEEVKQAIDIARVSELQHILDTATDGILVTDRSGLIESINGPAEALFGIDFDAASGKPLTELFAQESHRALLDYMNELSGPGVASVMNDGREVIGKEANGGLIPLFLTLGQMGEAGKFCAVLRDITQWKKAEEELVTARRAAETASEHKSDFLTRVSHEIRTPLNSIIGFSDVMIEERFGPIGNDRYREYLRDINRSGVHILDLINDLLDISKIEAGKMELSFEAVNLNQIVSETVALLQPQANVERIIIRTSLSRSVPRVVADARTIRQIILNLVSNAIKFTPTNGQVIVSTVYDDNGEVALKVRDTGRGMNEAEIEHVLKPFNQISVTEGKRGQGTGLGLPLTKALVEANRAQFDIESTPGDGTIVQVQFPTQRVLAD